MKISNPSHARPVHTHDCDCCTFLGTHGVGHKRWDAYLCDAGATVILRYGSEDAQNRSVPVESLGGKGTDARTALENSLATLLAGRPFHTDADRGRTYLCSFTDRDFGVIDAFQMPVTSDGEPCHDRIVLQWGLASADRTIRTLPEASTAPLTSRRGYMFRHAVQASRLA